VSAAVAKPNELTQDAYATDPGRGRFALADGVTNSRFPGEFARELVRAFVRNPPGRGQSFREWLRPVQQSWSDHVEPARGEVESSWFNRGASWVGHATFVGVTLELQRPDGPHLRAVGLGDATLIHVRDGRVVRAWPNERSADFSSETQALASTGELAWQPREMEQPVQAGDEVFVLSDAIGSWTLREAEAGRNPFTILRRLDRPGLFPRFVEGHRSRARRNNQMDVDDTTLVRFVIPE
jgi:hypothetical protein